MGSSKSNFSRCEFAFTSCVGAHVVLVLVCLTALIERNIFKVCPMAASQKNSDRCLMTVQSSFMSCDLLFVHRLFGDVGCCQQCS